MIRKLCVVLTVLFSVGALGVSTTGPAQARSVVPHHGVYNGSDQAGHHVSFSFGNHGQLTHFTVGSLALGSVYVSDGMWPETCHNGSCFKGQWTSVGTVTGSWRLSGSTTWTPWHTSFHPPGTLYAGDYRGADHTGRSEVRLSYAGGWFQMTVGSLFIAAGPVRDRRFEVCHSRVCVKGHWQSDHYVVGSWRYVDSTTWIGWQAHAVFPSPQRRGTNR